MSERAQLTYNQHSDQFFVLNDSTHYWTQKPGSKQWVKHAFVYAVNQPFQEVMAMTRVLAMAKHWYYFVHESCGNVYELKHDTLRRIDRSFPHRNQYGGTMFAWNGSAYMFGGYGFFQVKNVFTRFAPQGREWFEVITKGNNNPSPRSGSIFLAEQNQCYLLGGSYRSRLETQYLNDCWKYDFRKKSWMKLGELNEQLCRGLDLMKIDMNLPNCILRMSNRLIEFKMSDNTWTSYENPLVLNMQKIVSSKENKYLMYVKSNSNNDGLEVVVQSFDSLKEFKVGEFPIYQKTSILKLVSKEDYLWISLILNFFLFTLLFYIRRVHKLKFLKRSQKKLDPSDFLSSEWEILQVIEKNGEMELSALNTYFQEDGLSYETLKKRRETFLKNIRIKLALITRLPIEEILVETKHAVDKRMKMIHWMEGIELGNLLTNEE